MQQKRITFGELRINKTSKMYLNKAIQKNWVSEGENVRNFEERFAELFGYKYAIATSSGTDADICACASLYDYGAKRGDEIIVPALCFVSCPNSILAAGFVPKFVDVAIDTLNVDPVKIEESITDRTRAIMAVHTMGKPCDMDTIKRLAAKYNLKIIEDACEAHGAKYKNHIIGTIGDMGAFSFYAAHLIVCGEGGMIVTDHEDLANTLRSIKSHGRPPGSIYFDFQRIGFNSKMNDMEAAIGLGGIDQFYKVFNKRKQNIYHLIDLLKPYSDYFYFLKEENYETVSPHAFPLTIKNNKMNRDGLYKYLESNGIQCKTLFGSLPTQHNAFKFLNYKIGDFPKSEYIGQQGLHFGIHQYLTSKDIDYIGLNIKKYIMNNK